MRVLAGSNGALAWDQVTRVEGGIVPMGAARFALQDAEGARSYDLRSGDSEGLGKGCILGDRFVAPSDLGVTAIVACGRYRDRDTWVVRSSRARL